MMEYLIKKSLQETCGSWACGKRKAREKIPGPLPRRRSHTSLLRGDEIDAGIKTSTPITKTCAFIKLGCRG